MQYSFQVYSQWYPLCVSLSLKNPLMRKQFGLALGVPFLLLDAECHCFLFPNSFDVEGVNTECQCHSTGNVSRVHSHSHQTVLWKHLPAVAFSARFIFILCSCPAMVTLVTFSYPTFWSRVCHLLYSCIGFGSTRGPSCDFKPMFCIQMYIWNILDM